MVYPSINELNKRIESRKRLRKYSTPVEVPRKGSLHSVFSILYPESTEECREEHTDKMVYENNTIQLIIENRSGFQLAIKEEDIYEYVLNGTYNEEIQQEDYYDFNLMIEIEKLEREALQFLRKSQIVNVYSVDEDGTTEKRVMPWKDASISTINSYQKTIEKDGKILINIVKEKPASVIEAERRMEKMSTVKLEWKIDENLFNSDELQLIISDRKINIGGIISIKQLRQIIAEEHVNELVLKAVNDDQLKNLREQLAEVVVAGTIEEGTEGVIKYTRLKGIIIYKHLIYGINSLTVLKDGNGSNRIVFETA